MKSQRDTQFRRIDSRKAPPRPPFTLTFRSGVILFAFLAWLGTLGLLVGWWGRLVLRQAERIASLEKSLGLEQVITQDHWHRVQRMLYWESATFFALLLVSSGVLFWLYWRDHVRARGVQAFFASVTHELRTPLTGIRLQVESIVDLVESGNVHKEGAQLNTLSQRLLEDSSRLESQVDRTLELARVEGGGPVFIQALQIKPWLDRFLKMGRGDSQGKLNIHSQVEDLWIQADPAALQVIFKNLLENSLKHSKQVPVQVTLASFRNEKGIVLQFKDNGQGFQGEKKTLGKLFQKGASSSGTGVGLYLIQVLMQKMGGTVKFLTDPVMPGEFGFEVHLCFREGRNHD